jgi:methylmalonyl-CoA/ethylmalonyl-CoA epimerase
VNDALATAPLFQLGYVPTNIETALDYWTNSMRVGPFFELPHIAYDAVHFRGVETTIDCSLYIAYWGDIQIELVEQHCDSPSLYNEWLQAGQEGLHHICFATNDLRVARQDSIARGGRIDQELFFANGGGIYVDFGGGPGSLVEVLQAPPETKPMFEMMRTAGTNWDGRDPVRTVDRQ